MPSDSDSDGVISKRAKRKPGIVSDEANDPLPRNQEVNDDGSETGNLEAKGKEDCLKSDKTGKKRPSKRSRESDVESSVASDEDVMSKKKVRRDSDEELSCKPRKFISASTKKRREAVRSAREKKAALESESDDDSEDSSTVTQKVSGKGRGDSKKSVDTSDNSEETSDDKGSKSEAPVKISEGKKDSEKVDSKKNDDSSSAYNSDSDTKKSDDSSAYNSASDRETVPDKKGHSKKAESKSSTSSKESDGCDFVKQVNCSHEKTASSIKKSDVVKDREGSSSDESEAPLRKPGGSNKNAEKRNSGSASEEEKTVHKVEESGTNKPLKREKGNVSSTDSSSEDKPVKKIGKSRVATKAEGYDDDTDSPIKIKTPRVKHEKLINLSDDDSSSDDCGPCKEAKPSNKRPKKIERWKKRDSKSVPAKKQSKREGSNEISGSDSEDEPVKKAKTSSDMGKCNKTKKPSEKETKDLRKCSDSSSDSEDSLSLKDVSKKISNKERSMNVKDKRASRNEKEIASASSSDEELSSGDDSSSKSPVQKVKAEHSLSSSEGSGKENKSKDKGGVSKSGKDSAERVQFKHEISSSEDSDAPVKKSHKTSKEQSSKKVLKKSKKRSSSCDSSEKNNRKRGKTSKGQSAAERKIERLKKYVRIAGIFVTYTNLWKDCVNEKQKINKLKKLLEERGLKGNPTIEKCKRLKKKWEQKLEVEQLDLDNIIASEEENGQGYRTRRKSSAVIKQEKEAVSAAATEAAKKEAEFKKRFSRLKQAFGSSSSDSD